MKKLLLLSLVIAIFAAVFAFNATAATYGNLNYSVSNGEVVITGSFQGVTSVKIPSEINGCPVTCIGDEAFDACYHLSTITIPSSVTSIGSSAFKNCTSLTRITIPNSVTSIGSSAFYNCTGLSSITIPDSVTSIGAYVFSRCTNLTKIRVDENNTSYFSDTQGVLYNKDKTVLACCPAGASFTSFTIPNSVMSIYSYAFENCTSLTSITIPSSVTSIGYGAFKDCTNLSSIILPNREKRISIGSSAFGNCTNLKEVHITDIAAWCNISFGDYSNNPLCYADTGLYINGEQIKELIIPERVTSINSYAFYNCNGLASITIHDGVTSIGDEAFYGCHDLTTLTFEEDSNCTNIGDAAFENCSSLTSINIPNSVIWIGERAFNDCKSLEEITLPFVGASADATGYMSVFGYIFGYTTKNYSYPISGATYQYCTHNYTYYHYYIPTSIKRVTITSTKIPENSFNNCANLTSIIFPNSVTSIGSSAFKNCTSLKSITIPDSVTSIGEEAFYYCTSLTSITIPASVTSICSDAFSFCRSLTIYGYENSYAQTFAREKGIPFVALSRTVVSIEITTLPTKTEYYLNEDLDLTGIKVFATYNSAQTEEVTGYTTDISVFTVPGDVTVTVTYKGKSATFVVNVIDSSNLPKNYIEGTNIWWTYDEISGLLTVGGEGAIPDYARNTNNAPWYSLRDTITSIVVKDGITAIGNYAFWGLGKATAITVHASVKFVGIQFIRGTGVTEIELPGVEVIAGNAFGAAESLAKIILSEKVHDIQGNMFYSETLTVVAPEGSYVDYYLDMYTKVFGTKANPTFEADGSAVTRKILDFQKAGQSVFYTLYEEKNKTLTVEYSGAGKMTNFAYYSEKNIARGYTFSPTRMIFQNGVLGTSYTFKNILNVVLGDDIINLGNYALEMLGKIKDVELGDKMIRLGNSVFKSMSLKNFVIPEGVVLIGNNAFTTCPLLESVTFPTSIPAGDPNTMDPAIQVGMGADVFFKTPSAQGNNPTLKVITENQAVIDYMIKYYPNVAQYSGFID